MNLNYHKWLTLEITNNYFSSGISSDFHLIPFQKSTNNMKNYQVLIKKIKNTISFHAGISISKPFNINEEFKGLDELYFQLINEDPLFFNYTNIPMVSNQKIYYYENGIHPKAPHLLHKSDFVNEDDLIELKPKISNIQLPDNEVTVTVKTDDDNIIFSRKVDGTKSSNYLINLNHCNDGVYQLWMNDKLQETFFISNEEIHENCSGIIKIDTNKIIDQYQNQLKYSINFDARFVYWQYQVVVPKSRNIKVIKMNISGIDDETYNDPIEKEIIGGQTALIFTTSEAIQLQHKLEVNPLLTVTYSNEFSNRKNELELKLPNPEPEQIKKYNQEKDEVSFFSPTIVYV